MQDEQFTALLDRNDVKTIAFHDLAQDEIKNMFIACEKVGVDHGVTSREYTEMVRTLHQCLASILGRSGFSRHAYVTKDSDLSLYVQDGSFVFGMIFHRNREWDNPPEGHQQPGTWSLHS